MTLDELGSDVRDFFGKGRGGDLVVRRREGGFEVNVGGVKVKFSIEEDEKTWVLARIGEPGVALNVTGIGETVADSVRDLSNIMFGLATGLGGAVGIFRGFIESYEV